MALKPESLLKFTKATEFAVKMIEDDSSGASATNPTGTTVKILHLTAPVTAVGSNPAPSGQEMRVTGVKVHVAADNWAKFLEQAEEKDGVIYYKGDMHLDVSKPDGRMVNGQFTVTKPAKIWLTSIKFSKSGGALQQGRVNTLNNLIDNMFKGNQPLDLTVDTTGTASGPAPSGEEQKPDPEVVDTKAAKNGDKSTLEGKKEKEKVS